MRVAQRTQRYSGVLRRGGRCLILDERGGGWEHEIIRCGREHREQRRQRLRCNQQGALTCAEGWGPRSTVFDGRASHDACVVHAAEPASHSAAEQIEYTEYPEDRSVQRLYHDPTSAALAARRPRRARTAAGRLRTGPSLSQSAAACATACPAGRPIEQRNVCRRRRGDTKITTCKRVTSTTVHHATIRLGRWAIVACACAALGPRCALQCSNRTAQRRGGCCACAHVHACALPASSRSGRMNVGAATTSAGDTARGGTLVYRRKDRSGPAVRLFVCRSPTAGAAVPC